MSFGLYLSVILVIFLGGTSQGSALGTVQDSEIEKSPSGISPDAKLIIDQYIAATGGREAWQSLKSIQGNGTVSIPAASIAGKANFCITKDSYKNTFNMSGGQIKDATIITGRNGDVVWQLTGEFDQYKGKILEGVERLKSLRQFQFNQMLDLDKNFIRIELADIEDVNGSPAYKLQMVPRENPNSLETRYFDQKTHYIVRNVVTGSGPDQESLYGNYVTAGPVKMHTKTTRMAGGVVLMEINMGTILVNKPHPKQSTEMPYEIKVLLGEEKVSPPATKPAEEGQ